jgi:hypothetical protein
MGHIHYFLFLTVVLASWLVQSWQVPIILCKVLLLILLILKIVQKVLK